MRTLRPMTRRAAGVATLLSATCTLLLGLGSAADDPKRPVNWCRWRRSITPAHGWTGHLTSDASALRVEARDHILNMPGPVSLAYNSTCP